MSDTKTLTIRLPLAVYEKAAGLARAKSQSLNRLVQDGLELLDSREREKRLFDDFTAIAESGRDGTEVDFALEAQVAALGES